MNGRDSAFSSGARFDDPYVIVFVKVRVFAHEHYTICKRKEIVRCSHVVDVAELKFGVVRSPDQPGGHLAHFLGSCGQVHLVDNAAFVFDQLQVSFSISHLFSDFGHSHVESCSFWVGQDAFHFLELGCGAFGCGRFARFEERGPVIWRSSVCPGGNIFICYPSVSFCLPVAVFVDPCFNLGIVSCPKFNPSDVERLVFVLGSFCGLESSG